MIYSLTERKCKNNLYISNKDIFDFSYVRIICVYRHLIPSPKLTNRECVLLDIKSSERETFVLHKESYPSAE